jgi:D-tyrosyl-tRNA(Tyr) deacylase
MRVVVQRVSEASVEIDGNIKASIHKGLLCFLGFEDSDNSDDMDWICKKLVNLRIFSDEEGRMNKSVLDVEGEALLISQFTLHASTRKGNRPSFMKAAAPEKARSLYKDFLQICSALMHCKSGEFGADMKVRLLNDGPVTIIIDSKIRE